MLAIRHKTTAIIDIVWETQQQTTATKERTKRGGLKHFPRRFISQFRKNTKFLQSITKCQTWMPMRIEVSVASCFGPNKRKQKLTIVKLVISNRASSLEDVEGEEEELMPITPKKDKRRTTRRPKSHVSFFCKIVFYSFLCKILHIVLTFTYPICLTHPKT